MSRLREIWNGIQNHVLHMQRQLKIMYDLISNHILCSICLKEYNYTLPLGFMLIW